MAVQGCYTFAIHVVRNPNTERLVYYLQMEILGLSVDVLMLGSVCKLASQLKLTYV